MRRVLLGSEHGITALAVETGMAIEAHDTDGCLTCNGLRNPRRTCSTKAAAQLNSRNALLDQRHGNPLGLGIIGDPNDREIDLRCAHHATVLRRIGFGCQEDKGCLQ